MFRIHYFLISPSLSVPYPLFPHLSLSLSEFRIHYFLISPSSLSSLSIISSSLPRLSFRYPLFPHLSLVSQSLSIISSSLPRLFVPYPLFHHLFLVSQFLIHYFLISPSSLSSPYPLFPYLSPTLSLTISHPWSSPYYIVLNHVTFYLFCLFLNPSLLSSFSSSLYFLPSSVFFAPFFPHHTFSAIFSRYLLLTTNLSFCSCRMRRAERCRPLAAPWRPFLAANSAASWRSTPPSTTSTSDARAICWRATDRCPTTTAITSLFW